MATAANKLNSTQAPIAGYVGRMPVTAEQLTRLINSRGWDAGNESMRKAGRTVWSQADYNAAANEANRLFRATRIAP